MFHKFEVVMFYSTLLIFVIAYITNTLTPSNQIWWPCVIVFVGSALYYSIRYKWNARNNILIYMIVRIYYAVMLRGIHIQRVNVIRRYIRAQIRYDKRVHRALNKFSNAINNISTKVNGISTR